MYKVSYELLYKVLRNEAYNFFLHHVMKEKSDGQLHQCAKRIDDKFDV